MDWIMAETKDSGQSTSDCALFGSSPFFPDKVKYRLGEIYRKQIIDEWRTNFTLFNVDHYDATDNFTIKMIGKLN